MRKIKFHPQAREEIQHETRFYSKVGRITGNRFIEITKKATWKIQNNPGMWSVMTEKLLLRGYVLSVFPFTIIYASNDNILFIVAFAHHKKKPGYWKDRIKDIPF
jgi:toxin ParE1/3/4